ncbi:uncharacterized protein LOC107811135 isoform X1 [Nicotiana tabacum]|uniref:Uncharacterized protein LOC107811135 isoform X1 n=1 Tax=Nicotiana tabacum TaxID=4097 RepID=A0A1S4BRJ3_TOBAC|nr:PREDICTED: uncharacterized protein LOC107811135 isoform X3 [Nicotiana tabacum]
MKSHVPNVNQAYAMLLQDESQKMVAGGHCALTENMEPTALFTVKHSGQRQGKKNYNLECDYCHTRGHSRENCFKLMKCDFCNMKGHLKENCYKIIGYPPDFKPKTRGVFLSGNLTQSDGNAASALYPLTPMTSPVFTHEQYSQILNLLNKTSIGEPSAHMAVENSGHVQMPTGDSTQITHVGNCHLTGGLLHWEGEGDW